MLHYTDYNETLITKPYTVVDQTYVVLPAKNEGSRIEAVISDIKKEGYHNIIVVDDGSTDNTARISEYAGATVIRHKINLGAGAATQTGITRAISKGAHYIVTLDADQQHFPSDITKLVTKLIDNKHDVVIGNRFMGGNKIPFTREILNGIGNMVSYVASGIWVHDSQSGFKVMTASFAKKSPLVSTGYEFCIEIIRYMKMHKASYTEVPIKVMYSKETMEKGQNIGHGLKMISRIFRLF